LYRKPIISAADLEPPPLIFTPSHLIQEMLADLQKLEVVRVIERAGLMARVNSSLHIIHAIHLQDLKPCKLLIVL
jgi:hypothetical protein